MLLQGQLGGLEGAKSASPAPGPDGKLLFTLQNVAQSVVPAKASPDLLLLPMELITALLICRLWSQTAWVSIPTLPLQSSITLGKFLNFSFLLFLHL